MILHPYLVEMLTPEQQKDTIEQVKFVARNTSYSVRRANAKEAFKKQEKLIEETKNKAISEAQHKELFKLNNQILFLASTFSPLIDQRNDKGEIIKLNTQEEEPIKKATTTAPNQSDQGKQ